MYTLLCQCKRTLPTVVDPPTFHLVREINANAYTDATKDRTFHEFITGREQYPRLEWGFPLRLIRPWLYSMFSIRRGERRRKRERGRDPGRYSMGRE